MGRTLLPFRAALEREIESWKDFYRALRKGDKRFFIEVMDNARAHADAGALIARPMLSEIIFMSQLIEQQKMIDDLLERVRLLEQKLQEAAENAEDGGKEGDTAP